MARTSAEFVCQSCGATATKWAGRCGECGAWNSLTQEAASPPGSALKALKKSKAAPALFESLAADTEEFPRFSSGIGEFDRVVGGGLTVGSAILVGGDPGIGKSTLLMQIAASAAALGHICLYVSGEEAAQQLRMRAARLGVTDSTARIAAETNLGAILGALDAGPAPDILIIDSIQTLWTDGIDAPPGTVSQVRGSAQALIAYAKRRGTAVILVGHVTKDGQIAGPKVVEHMVDTVLYFEGDNTQNFRLLRSVKNRFGPSHEIGVFEMRGDGLREVTNPSELFLPGREGHGPGAAVFAGVEGSRPLLVEIQALVAPSPFAAPKRVAAGWDLTRLSMILAVLEARCGVRAGTHDVYLNVAGGLRISEPAADLAVAAALVSAIAGVALPNDCVYFGEVSLSGAVRPVSHAALRLKEAQKLGFSAAVMPSAGEAAAPDGEPALPPLALTRIKHLTGLDSELLRPRERQKNAGRRA